MKISSSAFGSMQLIPQKFTCQGDDINPLLRIEGIPQGAKSLALIMDDPDAPMGTWVHWVVFNISVSTKEIKESSIPGREGINSWGKLGYGGPCPPAGKAHRYFFKLYALDVELNDGALDKVSTWKKEHIEKAMEGHIIAQAEWVGLYQRKSV